jgi:hypothetical protein
MTAANPPIILIPSVREQLLGMVKSWQNTVKASEQAIQQAVHMSKKNQEYVAQDIRQAFKNALQNLVKVQKNIVLESGQNLTKPLTLLADRLNHLTLEQITILINDLSDSELQTSLKNYLEWLLLQVEEEPRHQISAEITGTLTVVAQDLPELEDIESTLKEKDSSFSSSTKNFVKVPPTITECVLANQDSLCKLCLGLSILDNPIYSNVGVILTFFMIYVLLRNKST